MAEQSKAGMSVGTKALTGLALGLAAGSAVTASGRASLIEAGAAVEVLGSLWINAILATPLPPAVAQGAPLEPAPLAVGGMGVPR